MPVSVVHRHRLVLAGLGFCGDHRQPADLVLRQPQRHPLQRRLRPHERDARGHDGLDGSVPESVRRCSLQIGQGHASDEEALAQDADPAEAVSPAEQRRFVDRRGVADHGRARLERVERDPGRRDRRRRRGGHRRGDLVERAVLHDRGCGGRVPAAAHGAKRFGDVDAAAAAPGGDEHAPLHLHEEEEGVAPGQVHDPVGHHADALNVRGPRGAPRAGPTPPGSAARPPSAVPRRA